MGMRNAETDPDLLASDPGLSACVDSVSVRLVCTATATYIEVWQAGEDLPAGGVRVAFRRYRRHLVDAPSPAVLAGWLAREVSDMDRQGWNMLRF